jgi:hypothetical protein
MASPTPGAIGLDAKSGSSKGGDASSRGRTIVGFASRRSGSRVGDGECFALADQALRSAGAKSASDYGTITPDGDYTWGVSVTLSDLQPGDVIQFRDYSYERTVVTQRSDATTTETTTEGRPHHTAIVQSVDRDGAVRVLEQNSPVRSRVHSTRLYFSSGTSTSGSRTTTITVRGTFWFYRSEAR